MDTIFPKNYNLKFFNSKLKAGFFVNQDVSKNKIYKNNFSNYVSRDSNVKLEENEKWHLEIPSINLNAEIKEGTTKEVMDDYIGHFEETEIVDGNIGLAAHNRGYKNNYFEKLKDLKQGEVVYYFYKNNCIEFIVNTKIIIKDTDWSYLEKTKDVRLTLITCVEGEKEYRRCIQCVKKQ